MPLSKGKLALLSLGRAWLAAMADPEVNVYDQSDSSLLSMVPAAPKLQADVLAAIPSLEVTSQMG